MRVRRLSRKGFDAQQSAALLVHGYALARLSWAQCDRLAGAVRAGFAAVPHGDLSETGTPSAASPDEVLPFSFVLGAVVACATVRATQTARCNPVRVSSAQCAAAARRFADARGELEALLARERIASPARAGLYLVAAGPLASARLEAVAAASVARAGEAPTSLIELSWDADPDAALVTLSGVAKLVARYD